jgi:hypothetical protein
MNESVALCNANRAIWLMIFGSATQFGEQPRLSSTVSNNTSRLDIAASYVKTNIRVVSCRVASFVGLQNARRVYGSEDCYQYLPLSGGGVQAQHVTVTLSV